MPWRGGDAGHDTPVLRSVNAAPCLDFAIAVLFMIDRGSAAALFASTIICGLAVGVNMVVQAFVWADYFRRTFLGTIHGLVLPAALFSSAIGAPLIDRIYDLAGSYLPAWWLFVGVYVAAMVLFISAVRPVARAAAAVAVR